MKKLSGFMMVAGFVALTGCAAKEVAPTPPPPPAVKADEKVTPERVTKTNTITEKAVVTAIDQKTRMVTLLGSDGKKETIHVGEEARNLSQVKKGDMVSISYLESADIKLHKKGTATPGAAMVEDGARAKAGEMPGAVAARATSVTVTVVKVDRKAPSLTVKGPDGKKSVLPVKDASRIEAVKVGDLLEITYTEAMAINVETPAKTKK